jgi:hypothetical protein
LDKLGFNYAESVYVRVYEDRIDLLRAAIVGPAGTPYHDGLFFFDVRFPAEYPKCPPVCDHLTPSSRLIFVLAEPSTVFFCKTYLVCAESSLPFRRTSVEPKPV